MCSPKYGKQAENNAKDKENNTRALQWKTFLSRYFHMSFIYTTNNWTENTKRMYVEKKVHHNHKKAHMYQSNVWKKKTKRLSKHTHKNTDIFIFLFFFSCVFFFYCSLRKKNENKIQRKMYKILMHIQEHNIHTHDDGNI